MSRRHFTSHLPPGLKYQIVFAVVITICAMLILPGALSADQIDRPAGPRSLTLPSAGSVSTTVHKFTASDFRAAAYSDWD